MQKFIIEGRLPALNDYVDSCRGSKFGGNDFKQKHQHYVEWCIKASQIEPMNKVNIVYKFYEESRRRDKDGVASFAMKVINDALQTTGILKNDNWRYVGDLKIEFYKDKENPRIEVELYDCE